MPTTPTFSVNLTPEELKLLVNTLERFDEYCDVGEQTAILDLQARFVEIAGLRYQAGGNWGEAKP